jgi:hypothetical protein
VCACCPPSTLTSATPGQVEEQGCRCVMPLEWKEVREIVVRSRDCLRQVSLNLV